MSNLNYLQNKYLIVHILSQRAVDNKACSLFDPGQSFREHNRQVCRTFNPYPTAFPYGNGMVLHFYQQQESSTTKTVNKVINKGLKTYV